MVSFGMVSPFRISYTIESQSFAEASVSGSSSQSENDTGISGFDPRTGIILFDVINVYKIWIGVYGTASG